MSERFRLSLLVLAVLALPMNASADESAAVYEQYCAFCHGEEGAGDGMAAAMLQPQPTDFTKAEYWERADKAALATTILKGKVGTPMVPFADRLDEKQATAMVEFLSGFAGPPPE